MILTIDWQTIASYIYTHSSGAKVTFYIDAKYARQDIANNKTYVDIRYRTVLATGSTLGGSGYNFTCTGCPQIQGSDVWWFATEQITSASNYEVQHESNGTKQITLSATAYNGYLGMDIAFSGIAILPTIPRASTAYTGDTFIGSTTSIIINKSDPTFKHTLKYEVEDDAGQIIKSETIAEKITTDSYDWIVPTSFYELIPNSKQIMYKIVCDTYDVNNNFIGTKKTITAGYVNETVNKPDVNISVVDTNQKTKDLTGKPNIIVRGYSNVEITWSATAKNSATLKNANINGVSVSSSPTPFNNASTNIFTLSATDSRGITSSISTDNATNPIVNYIPLTVDVTFARIGPTTGKVGATFSGNYFNQSFGTVDNTLILSWKYRLKGATDWVDGGTFVNQEDYTINNNKFNSNGTIELDGSFNYKNIYEFALFYEDKLVNTYVVKPVRKGEPVYWWNKDGLHVLNNLTLNGNKIIDSGSNSNGEWIKFENGTMICRNMFNIESCPITSAWGNAYVYDYVFSKDFPQKFIDTPNVEIVNGGNDSGWAVIVYQNGVPTNINPGGCGIMRMDAQTFTNQKVGYNAIGRWK